MANIGIFGESKYFSDNIIFGEKNGWTGRNNAFSHFIMLRQFLEKHGHTLNTIDRACSNRFDLIINVDSLKIFPNSPQILLLLENPYHLKLKNRLSFVTKSEFLKFRAVLSPFDIHQCLENATSIKIPYNVSISKTHLPKHEVKKISLFATNTCFGRFNFQSRELYSYRYNFIQYMMKNFPENFIFYGSGWEMPSRSTFIGNVKYHLTKRNIARFSGIPGVSSIDYKELALNESTYTLCCENIYGLGGYVSEKILSAIGHGVIPLYWGKLDGVQDPFHIDISEFSSIPALVDFLLTRTYDENVKLYSKQLSGDMQDYYKTFSIERFVMTVLHEVYKVAT